MPEPSRIACLEPAELSRARLTKLAHDLTCPDWFGEYWDALHDLLGHDLPGPVHILCRTLTRAALGLDLAWRERTIHAAARKRDDLALD